AERTLVDFYRKLGYEDGFYLRETVWLREKITSLGSEGVCSCSISPIMPAEYNRRRNEWLRGRLYVAYADAEITYQKKLSQLSGADIYGIDAGTVRGCMTVERINSDRLLIKELLVSEKYFTEAIKQMSQQFQAQEYVIRTPAFLVQPGGTIRPFAMLRIHGERKLTVAPAELGYLAFAFD
ncbi:MAG: GNAT family N-acetyltransferase, partial [Firmicutes bacterium]|nr:GNAT family N-acetyltransferase [Bacillota bacterium]